MHRVLLFAGFLLGLFAGGCNDDDPNPEVNAGFNNPLTDGLSISFGDSLLINHHGIDYYDYSTHTMYLKETHPLFQEPVDWELGGMSFTVYAYQEKIYSGILFPAWWSSIPSGTYILWPSFYSGDMIRIDYGPALGNLEPGDMEDPRNDQRILEALQEYGQYHPGLSLEIGTIQYNAGEGISFTYTLTNDDSFDYYVLSPDKMGVGLFHYFTNGLYLYNQETGWLQHQIKVENPEPWDSWESGWLDLLNRHTSKSYQVTYEIFDQVPPGTYSIYFRFPGLTHVEKGDRIFSGGRIWMGDLEVSNEIEIE